MKIKMKALKLNPYYENALIMFLIVITNTGPIHMSQEKSNRASDTFGKVSGTQYTIKTPEQSLIQLQLHRNTFFSISYFRQR